MPNIAQLRTILQTLDDNTLEAFLHGYTLGVGAEMFVSVMILPNQRVEFLTAIAKAYPKDWQEAVEKLSKEK